MNFDLTDDQEALRDGIRAVCEGRFTVERVRAGFDRAMWNELAETGVFSLLADGFGWADAAIAFEELGRAVVPGPIVWGVLAHGVVDGIVGGLERPADGLAMVEHVDAIDVLLVIDDNGATRVDPGVLAGVERLDWPLDFLTPVARVASFPAGEPVADGATVATWRLQGAVLTAAFQAGMAARCVEMATQYSQARRQFDRPIGSFQAVKHLLADAVVRAEVARTAVHAAAVTLDDPEVGDVARAIAGAKLLAGEAALKNAKTSLQVHGGMGFTWEVDVHLYLKRAWVLDTVFGSAAAHADGIAAGLPAAQAPAVSTDHLGGRLEERELLVGFNDWYRGVVVNKLAGLSDDDATRVMTATGLSPMNIVGHLAACEIGWFFEKFGGGGVDPFWEPYGEFQLQGDETVESMLMLYSEACARSRAVVREARSLDVQSAVPHDVWGNVSLRWVLVHMLEETARHAGHLDLMREEIDGQTG